VNSGRLLAFAAVAFFASCSGFSTLTPQNLNDAKVKWASSRPAFYTMVVKMEGDRLDASEYEVHVENGLVTSLKRNGTAVIPALGQPLSQDYSMDGLFNILEQEMALAETEPVKLGAPAGYRAYLMAKFESDGRLLKYRRTVGGGANSTIDIVVQKFESHAKPGV
jgi:hypothetical protein